LNTTRTTPELPSTLEFVISPTSDCTDQTVRDWWQTQIQTGRDLSIFSMNVTAATMTMPGERLTEQIEKLRGLELVEPVPVCASAALQAAVQELHVAAVGWLTTLDSFNRGAISMDDAAFKFAATDQTFRDAQQQVRENLP
jgi:hypothetical protein